MEKRTNLIFRRIFLPDWNADMEEFLNNALAELQRYSEARHFPEWAHPKPEISELDEEIEVDFLVPGIEPDSVNVEPFDSVVILSGLRWCVPPGEKSEKLVSFRRVVQLPAPVIEENWSAACEEAGRVKLIVRKADSPNPSPEKRSTGGRKTSSTGGRDPAQRRNAVSGTVNGKPRWGTPAGNGVTLSRINRDLASGMTCARVAEKHGLPADTVRELKRRLGLPKM